MLLCPTTLLPVTFKFYSLKASYTVLQEQFKGYKRSNSWHIVLQHFNASFFSFNLYKWVTLDYKNKLNVIAGPKVANSVTNYFNFNFLSLFRIWKLWLFECVTRGYKKNLNVIKIQILVILSYNPSSRHFQILFSISELHCITRTV